MALYCFKCGKEVSSQKIGRKETCSSCGEDAHVCVNCIHYDERAYNQCRESQAERVLEKKRSNFCDYFSPIQGARAASSGASKDDAKQKLDDLFK